VAAVTEWRAAHGNEMLKGRVLLAYSPPGVGEFAPLPGSQEIIDLLDSDLPGAAGDSVGRVVSRYLLSRPGTFPFALITLSLTLSDSVRLVARRGHPTAPQLVNRQEISQRVAEVARAQRADGRVDVWIQVAKDGHVEDVRLAQSSGSRMLDTAILDLCRRARFSPQKVDGFPIPRWIKFPVTMSPRKPG
jgi:TonB family protein